MTDALLVETATRALRDAATPAAIAESESTGWAPKLWEVAAGIGLPWISVPDAFGGAGGSISDAVAVLQVVGFLAVPLPLAETGLLAGWLLSAAGIPAVRLPASITPQAIYTVTIVRGAPHPRAAERFVAFLLGPPGRALIERYGLLPGKPRMAGLASSAPPAIRSLLHAPR